LIAVILFIFSLSGVLYLPREMKRKLSDTTIRGRFTESGLVGVYILERRKTRQELKTEMLFVTKLFKSI